MSTQPDLKPSVDPLSVAAEARSQRWRGQRRRWRIERPDWVTPGLLTWTRWVSIIGWLVAFAIKLDRDGVPFDREQLLLWMVIGLIAASIGKRAAWTVIVDFLPFALVLVVYDYLRGLADTLGMPTWWHPQLDVDKFLFGATVPTIWLQEHFKNPKANWWDVTVSLTYVSFFVLPYLTAAVFWLRSRAEFRRWAGRFVALSFLGFGLFALIPAAPPWAAARCSAAQIADHPSHPPCMSFSQRFVPHGGLLGPVDHPRPGASAYFERLSGRGWPKLHLGIAQGLLDKGQGTVDQVAAVPSLHAGGTMLFVIFIWRRVRVWWKAVLVAYLVLMAVALAYAGEHYISDVLAGWLAAGVVCMVFDYFERRRRKRSEAVDTLDGPPHAPAPTASRMENPCPPIATMPSST
ncbi:MAG: inositol phosphorylceramide synthase [Pseudonocardiales bacterium]|nr:MAG: inositol phosphorylceramide synthase [Pseudonocardiales bacterium]